MLRRTASASTTTSCPTTRAVPLVARDRVVRIFVVVDLPAPFGPSSPWTVPAGTVSVRPSRARTFGRPRPPGYVLTRSTASTAGGRMGMVVLLLGRTEAPPMLVGAADRTGVPPRGGARSVRRRSARVCQHLGRPRSRGRFPGGRGGDDGATAALA